MIYILKTDKQPTHNNQSLLNVDRADLGLCPETIQAADFLQTMDGWI